MNFPVFFHFLDFSCILKRHREKLIVSFPSLSVVTEKAVNNGLRFRQLQITSREQSYFFPQIMRAKLSDSKIM